jgi:23S rRNA pseudouridine955/2504/2580 synthase
MIQKKDPIIFIVEDKIKTKLLKFLNLKTGSPNSLIQRLIRKKKISINDKIIDKNELVKSGDNITVFYPFEKYDKNDNRYVFEILEKHKKSFQDMIVYENDNFIIINKDEGYCSQGGKNIRPYECIDELARSIYPEARLVHRLDRETSGLMIIGKNHNTAQEFCKIFRERLVRKEYLSVLQHRENGLTLGIEKTIRSYQQKQNDKFVSFSMEDYDLHNDSDEKINEAISSFKVLKEKNGCLLVLMSPITGRSHQLRSHGEFIKQPIIGDDKYGSKFKFDNVQDKRVMLHSSNLFFTIYGKKYTFLSEPTFLELFF